MDTDETAKARAALLAMIESAAKVAKKRLEQGEQFQAYADITATLATAYRDVCAGAALQHADTFEPE